MNESTSTNGTPATRGARREVKALADRNALAEACGSAGRWRGDVARPHHRAQLPHQTNARHRSTWPLFSTVRDRWPVASSSSPRPALTWRSRGCAMRTGLRLSSTTIASTPYRLCSPRRHAPSPRYALLSMASIPAVNQPCRGMDGGLR